METLAVPAIAPPAFDLLVAAIRHRWVVHRYQSHAAGPRLEHLRTDFGTSPRATGFGPARHGEKGCVVEKFSRMFCWRRVALTLLPVPP